MIKTSVNPTGTQLFSTSSGGHTTNLNIKNIVYKVANYGSTTTAYIPNVNSTSDTIDWGDGTTTTPTSTSTGVQSHTYSDGLSEHTVIISGGNSTLLPGRSYYAQYNTVSEIVNIPKTITGIAANAFGCTNGYTNTYLKSIDLTNYGGTQLNNYCFAYCKSLVSVIISDGVTKLGTSNSDDYSIFRSCTSLTTVVLPSSLTTLYINPFIGCTSLTSVSLSESNTTWKVDQNCLIKDGTTVYSMWGNATIPSYATVIYQYARAYDSTFTSLNIPANITRIEDYAFYSSKGIITLTFASGSKLTRIGDYAFYASTKIKSVDIPVGVTYIGDSAFIYISEMTSATIPEGVTYIGANAFRQAYVLESITVPSTVTYIGRYQFYQNTNMKYACVKNSFFGSGEFYNCSALKTLELTTNFNSTSNAASSSTVNSTLFYNVKLTKIKFNGTLSQWNNNSALVTIFGRLKGDGSGNAGTLSGGLYTNATPTVQYNFVSTSYVLTVSSNDSSLGSVSGGGTYEYGDYVTITATPTSSSTFSQWNDGDTNQTRYVVVSASTTYTALFSGDSGYTVTIGIDSEFGSSDVSHFGIKLVDASGNETTVAYSSSIQTYSNIVRIYSTNDVSIYLSDAYYWVRIWGASGTSYCSSETTTGTIDITLSENTTIQYSARSSDCLAYNTLITMSDGTLKYIKDIRKGDEVLAYDQDTEKLSYSTIEGCDGVIERYGNSYDIYMFSDGTEVEVVNEHRIYNVEENKLKLMRQWSIGEHALNQDGEQVELIKHVHIDKQRRYCSIFGTKHNYFANGILTGDIRARYPFFKSVLANAN